MCVLILKALIRLCFQETSICNAFIDCRNVASPWGNEDTQQIIDILGSYNIKATFFVVGAWVDKYPESVKALSDAGHEVMNHSDNHAHFNALSSDEIIANISTCNEKISAITGVTPTLFRPPYGEYDDHVVAAVRSLGMEPIQWDVDVSHTDSSSCKAIVSPSYKQKLRQSFYFFAWFLFLL